MTDGMAVELNMKVYLNFWKVTVAARGYLH